MREFLRLSKEELQLTIEQAAARKGWLASSYDLYRLIESGVAERASQNMALFDQVLAHRQVFFSQNWVDYKTLRQGALRLSGRFLSR